MTNHENKNPLPKLTTESLLADKPLDYTDTPETRREGAHYLAGRLDEIVGEDGDPAIEGFYPEGTKVASSNHLILGNDVDRAGYRAYNGLFNVVRKTIPGEGVHYKVSARHSTGGYGYFERDLSMTLSDGELIDFEVARPEKTGGEMQPGALYDLSDIDDYIDGTNGDLYPVDHETQEVAYRKKGSRVRIVNKSRMRKIAKGLNLIR